MTQRQRINILVDMPQYLKLKSDDVNVSELVRSFLDSYLKVEDIDLEREQEIRSEIDSLRLKRKELDERLSVAISELSSIEQAKNDMMIEKQKMQKDKFNRDEIINRSLLAAGANRNIPL